MMIAVTTVAQFCNSFGSVDILVPTGLALILTKVIKNYKWQRFTHNPGLAA